MRIYYDPKLKPLSRKLRKEGTLGEVLLWYQLKGRKIKGFLFTRQKPIGRYIVDFYCSRLRLAIEIDGSSHNDNFEKDFIRQKELEEIGIRFMRFLESDVRNNLDGVVIVIEQWIEENS